MCSSDLRMAKAGANLVGGCCGTGPAHIAALAAKLKGQFGMISDLVTATYMSSSRGASEPMRVRAMREGMASIKVQLEIAITQTIAKHEKHD